MVRTWTQTAVWELDAESVADAIDLVAKSQSTTRLGDDEPHLVSDTGLVVTQVDAKRIG